MFAISRRSLKSSQIVLVLGAVAATVLGALTALQFDRLAAVGKRLMRSEGQEALVQAFLMAGVAGFLCWMACALVVGGVRNVARRPYDALTDRLERLIDGEIDTLADLHAPDAGVRRLARAVFLLRERAITSRRSEAAVQALYDAVCYQQADERRLLMGMLTRSAVPPSADKPRVGAEGVSPASLDIPAYVGTGKTTEAVHLDLTDQFGSLDGGRYGGIQPFGPDLSKRPFRFH